VIREALVNSPLNHSRYLHGAGKGHVTIACKTSGFWEQHSYTTQELDQVLPAYSGGGVSLSILFVFLCDSLVPMMRGVVFKGEYRQKYPCR
jgi:hypothetical protein